MDEKAKQRVSLIKRFELRRAKVKNLQNELRRLEEKNKALEDELTEKEEMLYNLFSYIQSNS